METRKTIFCETGFWDRFSSDAKRLPGLSLDEKSLKEQSTWIGFAELFLHSDVWLDCSLLELQCKVGQDENLKMLWKKSTNGECGLECDKDNFPRIQEDELDYQEGDSILYPSALYLTTNGYEQQAKDWGVINVSSEQYLNYEHLFVDKGREIKKGESTDWSLLRDWAIHNMNAMVIVDNYVMNKAKNNLYSVLDFLLPEKMKVVFYLTIFTLSEDTVAHRRQIEQHLSQKKPKLKVKVEVFNSSGSFCSKYYHDRTIISNNIWIGVGAGIDLFRLDIKKSIAEKSTTIPILYPKLQQGKVAWASKAYDNLIVDAMKVLKDNGETSENILLKKI